MKWAGILLLALAITAFGLAKSAGLSRKARLLKTAEQLCRRVGEEMRLTGAAPADILAALSENTTFRELPFLAVFRETPPAQFHPVWKREAAVFCAKNGLNGEEVALLCDFGLSLGTTDLAGQRQLCEAFATRFSARQQEAADAYKDKGRLYASLGGIGGLAAALILI